MASSDHQDEWRRRPSRRELTREQSESTLRGADIAGDHKATPTFTQRFCSDDSTKFRKYIESTTTHGVVRVFTGKSKVRRLFWALVVLVAAGVCLYNIVNRIIYLASDPTSTTVTTKSNKDGIVFPAVTICNLNIIKRSEFARSVNESELMALDQLFFAADQVCENHTVFNDYLSTVIPNSFSYRRLQDVARHRAEDMIVECSYAGEECSYADFSEVLTRLGYCYTFNGGTLANKTLMK